MLWLQVCLVCVQVCVLWLQVCLVWVQLCVAGGKSKHNGSTIVHS
jgi:hypothetical protein